MSAPKATKLWGGRFTGDTDPVMEKFNNSLKFDKIMWREDLQGSEEYAKAMVATGILTSEEMGQICAGLEAVRQEWQSGSFVLQESDEDIHTANERRLTEIVGSVGGKLHTGRSRNDQVATDVRLWLRTQCDGLLQQLHSVVMTASSGAETYVDILQAGFTHLQPAQVVRYSHWLLSYIVPLLRDMERLIQLRARVNVCPLGSGALAGHPFGINRPALGAALLFEDISINSMDATCDRDFVAEFLSWASLLMVHLSQFAEDVIILNMQQCLTMSDAYCTGSSLMPQKKNPDALELLRGKSGRIIGNATGFLCTLKGLPRCYNKDLQEDKEPLIDTVSTLQDCLSIMLGVVSTMAPVEEKLKLRLVPEMLATDIAEYLVRKGTPFRETHHIAGAAVKLAESKNVPLDHLTLADLRTLHPLFEEDVAELWSYSHSAESRASVGGTSRQRVLEQVQTVRERSTALAK
ncbi:argininosuccinate lyase [Ochromonadaceae sp. CCMP2298]|nr:argininosuccinate lyase [Ochromonadaceae sp. CCMP2298]